MDRLPFSIILPALISNIFMMENDRNYSPPFMYLIRNQRMIRVDKSLQVMIVNILIHIGIIFFIFPTNIRHRGDVHAQPDQSEGVDLANTGELRTKIPREKLAHWRSEYFPRLRMDLVVKTTIQNEGNLKTDRINTLR